MSKVRPYLLGSVLCVLVPVLSLTIIEFWLRQMVIGEAPEKRDHVVETSYMPVKFKGDYEGLFWGVPFSTNRYGFRSEADFSKTPPPKEYRILSLGDSIGFGIGIAHSAHYTQVLQKHLNQEAGDRFHVINAGGQGYSPSSYYVYLKNEGLQFRPSMVLVEIELCNDVTDEALLHWEPDTDNPETVRAVRGGRYIRSWDGNLLATYSRGTYFFERTYLYTDLVRRYPNFLYHLFPSRPFSQQKEMGGCYYNLGFDRYLLDEERIESGWRKTFRSLSAIGRLLEKNGIRFFLLIMPSRYVFEQDAGRWRDFATRLMERASREATQKNIPHMDLTEPIKKGGGETLYFDFVHLTEEGNRVVGEALARNLSGKLDR